MCTYLSTYLGKLSQQNVLQFMSPPMSSLPEKNRSHVTALFSIERDIHKSVAGCAFYEKKDRENIEKIFCLLGQQDRKQGGGTRAPASLLFFTAGSPPPFSLYVCVSFFLYDCAL